MSDEYKALSVVNLPFIEERYEPGQTIPRSSFEAVAREAEKLLDDRTDVDENATPHLTADDHIAALEDGGSISSDLDAPLHPDHLPVDPSGFTVAAMVARAEEMVAQLESEGVEVPAKLREFAEMSVAQIERVESTRRLVQAKESAAGGENARRR